VQTPQRHGGPLLLPRALAAGTGDEETGKPSALKAEVAGGRGLRRAPREGAGRRMYGSSSLSMGAARGGLALGGGFCLSGVFIAEGRRRAGVAAEGGAPSQIPVRYHTQMLVGAGGGVAEGGAADLRRLRREGGDDAGAGGGTIHAPAAVHGDA
jgi:hypothetical protein